MHAHSGLLSHVHDSAALPGLSHPDPGHALSCHRVREADAGGWVQLEHIHGAENPDDILTKPSPWFGLKVSVELSLPWKGNMVDAPSGASDPEGSDAGPGSTVPEEQLSLFVHDSSNMSGHAIPAMPCGDWCAALFDAEPTEDEILHGVQLVTMFDLLRLFKTFVFQILF